jgi:hypothetical protein
MFEDLGYAAVLRLIGQVRETLRIESFTVSPDGDDFIIRDKTRNRTQLTHRERAFLASLESSHGSSPEKKDWLRLASGVLEWRLTQEDLVRFERDRQERRRLPAQMVDSHSISQILRAVCG